MCFSLFFFWLFRPSNAINIPPSRSNQLFSPFSISLVHSKKIFRLTKIAITIDSRDDGEVVQYSLKQCWLNLVIQLHPWNILISF